MRSGAAALMCMQRRAGRSCITTTLQIGAGRTLSQYRSTKRSRNKALRLIMNRLPFDPYDFFGYLASGLLVAVGMDRVLGFPRVLGQDFKVVDAAVLLLGVYVAGQIVATLAKATFEDGFVDKILGRPSVNLFREKRPLIRGALFRGFYQPLPANVRKKVMEKARGKGVVG